MLPQPGGLPRRRLRLSLKLKLLGVLIPLSIAPIALASVGWYETMFRSSMSHSAAITSQYSQLVAENISQYTDGVSHALDPLLIDLNFQKYLKTPASDIVSQARYSLAFEPLIQSFIQSHPELLGVVYTDRKGKILYQSYQKRMNYIYPFDADPFFAALPQIRETTLSPPHSASYLLDKPEEILSVVRPAFDLSSGQISAWLIVDIRAEYFRELMRGAYPDKDGQILLYHPQSGAVVANQQMDRPLLERLRGAVAEHDPQAREWTFTSERASYQAVLEDVKIGGWKLVWVAPLDAITDGVRRSLRWTLMIAVFALALCCFIAFPAMQAVLRPLDKLVGGMRKLPRGRYEPIPQPAGHDEIGFLVQTYNRMVVELERMEREVYQSKLREREKEVLQLQAQTNPHFFFNTLETLDAYAALNKAEAVSDMVQTVSRMMRYNVRNDDGWAPLREEIAYIRDFLNIHRHRNGKEVRTEWEIDPALTDVPVMRLSIQPFVENALKYGWSPALSAEEFRLTVSAGRIGSALRIAVRDTGVGADPAALAMISRLLEQGVDEADPYFKRHTGIYNVYRRLVLVYGPRVRVAFRGGLLSGTEAEITIEDG
ncbi:cache domain-containing sensor histidine kinase [Cohnella zeiphila]|uniref:Histidine kinase n=1 Tax=Cohnella zeiphila TaxID=2761120 RepID=A0A7X0SSP5_9BACL|nr:sensor histidine kinase [Cohnella zeiphila]MBB6735417.1 histidine kinase [Cohnella zeiphila]